MNKEVLCIMLIDDDEEDNFFHERIIKKFNPDYTVIVKQSGLDAIEYLNSDDELQPDFIFLDINMPKMDGWEFLKEYKKMIKKAQSQTTVIMLSTSNNREDKIKLVSYNVTSEFNTKPLTQEMLGVLVSKSFNTVII